MLESASIQIEDPEDVDNTLSQNLEQLDLASTRKIWTVGWDSFVVIMEDNLEKKESKVMGIGCPESST